MTALVGPLQPIYYHRLHGPDIVDHAYLPADTRDWRWAACIDHHPACWCREAERAEHAAEIRSELREARRVEDAARAALLLHARRPGNHWIGDRCITCLTAYPCPTRSLLKQALWPHAGREDYPL